MRKWAIYALLFAGLSACKKQQSAPPKEPLYNNIENYQFDTAKWKTKIYRDYPFRDDLLEGLVASKLLKKMDREGIIEMLGEPYKIDNNHLFYMVRQERLGFFPLHTTVLVIKLFEDGTVEWVKVHE